MSSSNRKSALVAFLIWLSITVFYCYQYILRVLPNIISAEVMTSFEVGASEFGSFAGVYYLGYIILHIPIGIAISRFGAKTVLPISIAITALGLIPLIYPISWNAVVIGRALTGIGSSAAGVGALQIFRILYPAKFARMLGLMVCLGLLTVVQTGEFLVSIIAELGITYTLNVFLYSGLFLSLVTFYLMPKTIQENTSDTFSDLKSILLNYKLIFAALFAGLMVGPIEGFADAWGNAFLVTVYGVDKVLASYLTLLIFFGMSAGCIMLPYITDKTGYYYGTTIFSGLVMFCCFMLLLSTSISIDSLKFISIIIGIFSAYQVIILAKITTFVPEEKSGIAGAVANMIIMAFGGFFHNAIGISLDLLWNGTIIDGLKIYDADSYIKSISVIPISIIVAVIGFFIISTITIIRTHNTGNGFLSKIFLKKK